MRYAWTPLLLLVVGCIVASSPAWAQFSGQEILLRAQEPGWLQPQGMQITEMQRFVRPSAEERMAIDKLLALPSDFLDPADREFLSAARKKPMWQGWEQYAVAEIAKEYSGRGK